MSFQPLPKLDIETEAFWTGGADGHLNIHRCGECRVWFHPPAPVCPDCLSMNVAAEPASGNATVATFTINHQPWAPDLEVPYVVAIVELEDQAGVRLMTRLIDVDVNDVSIGMAVQVEFDNHEDVWIPLFKPVQGGAV